MPVTISRDRLGVAMPQVGVERDRAMRVPEDSVRSLFSAALTVDRAAQWVLLHVAAVGGRNCQTAIQRDLGLIDPGIEGCRRLSIANVPPPALKTIPPLELIAVGRALAEVTSRPRGIDKLD